ncbi:MAG: HRDC domain-containing protein [Planctomycetales bacterium]|nr:HRDC domain-containing protein [Planctomycetales bacterium]
MNYERISDNQALAGLCKRIESAEVVAYDTEFVSEFNYYPDLCLVQVAFDDQLAIIDPKQRLDVEPFWQSLVAGKHETIVHAGREELLFCWRSVGEVPARWFDVQLAAGMVSMEYPISYRKLLKRLLDKTLPKGETRTDWRKRPLTESQLDYALHDVLDLRRVRDLLMDRLTELGRVDWLHDESELRIDKLLEAESQERWPRLSGFTSLSGSAVSIAVALWRWRDELARRRDTLPKRVLRDDLLVELARRGKSSEKQIRAIRGMQRRDYERYIPELSETIERALHEPPPKGPNRQRVDLPQQVQLLTQFLNTALACTCRAQAISPSVVGTVQDVQDLIVHELNLAPESDREMPSLITGWRAEIVGDLLEKVLNGKVAMRLVDPLSDRPLQFIELADDRLPRSGCSH